MTFLYPSRGERWTRSVAASATNCHLYYQFTLCIDVQTARQHVASLACKKDLDWIDRSRRVHAHWAPHRCDGRRSGTPRRRARHPFEFSETRRAYPHPRRTTPWYCVLPCAALVAEERSAVPAVMATLPARKVSPAAEAGSSLVVGHPPRSWPAAVLHIHRPRRTLSFFIVLDGKL